MPWGLKICQWEQWHNKFNIRIPHTVWNCKTKNRITTKTKYLKYNCDVTGNKWLAFWKLFCHECKVMLLLEHINCCYYTNLFDFVIPPNSSLSKLLSINAKASHDPQLLMGQSICKSQNKRKLQFMPCKTSSQWNSHKMVTKHENEY